MIHIYNTSTHLALSKSSSFLYSPVNQGKKKKAEIKTKLITEVMSVLCIKMLSELYLKQKKLEINVQ